MFGQKLKKLRESDNISQVKFAKEIGFSQASIAAWENGTREPGLETLLKIALYFNVSVDYLIGNKAIKEKSPSKITSEEQALLDDFRSLPIQERAQAIEYVHYLADKRGSKNKHA